MLVEHARHGWLAGLVLGLQHEQRHRHLEALAELVDHQETAVHGAARGAQAGAINKWKIEGKSSGAQYEFDIDDDSDGDADNDYEVQVDAKSGKVTSSGR